jgi:hypothetical protein
MRWQRFFTLFSWHEHDKLYRAYIVAVAVQEDEQWNMSEDLHRTGYRRGNVSRLD